MIAGTPAGLSRALLKLEKGNKVYPMDASQATAHLFIVNPLRADALAALFSTHPPIRERVKRLESMVI